VNKRCHFFLFLLVLAGCASRDIPASRLKWVFHASGRILSSPAVAPDGSVYFGSEDYKFYALSPDGTLKWSFETGYPVHSSPALAEDGSTCWALTEP
jgi:outer membrane protein assembly factor BamB